MTIRSILIAHLYLIAQGSAAQPWQWSSQIGGPGNDEAFIAGVDGASAVYLYGTYALPQGVMNYQDLYIEQDTLYGSTNGFLAKYNSDGTLAWVSVCASPFSTSTIKGAVLDTVEQKLYVVGVYTFSCTLDTISLTAPYVGAFLSKWDLDGHCLWARNVATNGPNLLQYMCDIVAVTLDDQGRLYVGGTTPQYGPDSHAGRQVPQGTYVAAYNSSGDTLWTRMLATYDGPSRILLPLAMRTWNGHLFVYNVVGLSNTSDTLTVDTITLTNVQGGGYGLFRMDPANGAIDWFLADGFPTTGGDAQSSQRLHVDDTGHLYVAGQHGMMAIIGTDTLFTSTIGVGGAFLAGYDADGTLQWVRAFEATEGANFVGMYGRSDGSMLLTGFIEGSATWDGISLSTSSRDLIISTHSSTGECMDIMSSTGPALGLSITEAADGIYVTGLFPPVILGSPPFDPITIGGDTYDTHGWKDAFLAKHELITGVGSLQMAGSNELVIYANPNRGSFSLQVPDALVNEHDLVLRIYDSTGHLILEQPLDMATERPHLDVFDGATGFYNVTLTNGHRTYSGSMVVE